MKTRHGFVSNSSSSSFVVIGNKDYEQPTNFIDEPYVVFDEGEYKFGWQNTLYDDMASRINFAWIQANDSDVSEFKDMLYDVIKEHLGCQYIIEKDFGGDYGTAYIDHQSSIVEGENGEIFKSKEVLARFLFCPDSYIQCGNDNSTW